MGLVSLLEGMREDFYVRLSAESQWDSPFCAIYSHRTYCGDGRIQPENGFLDRMTGCKGFIGKAPDVI